MRRPNALNISAFLSLFSLFNIAFAQNGSLTIHQKDSIQRLDQELIREAFKNPIVKYIYDDTTCHCDYIEQHYYSNGQLYWQVPVINGKKNGLYEEYHPNGQLFYRNEMTDGYYVRNEKNDHVRYNRFGEIEYYGFSSVYRNNLYLFNTGFPFGEKFSLMVYLVDYETHHHTYVAEYRYENKRWIKFPYHGKAVSYANQLLRLYLKECKKRPEVFE